MNANDDVIKDESKRFLEFKLGNEFYAVELLKVREVITPPELTPIPKAAPYVCGLMNLRGLVLTVIDLRKRLSISPGKDTTENSIVIFDLGDRLIGAWVDSISRVATAEKSSIKPVPESDQTSVTQYLNGVIQFQGKLTLWLDIERLLAGTTEQNKKIA
jgi:purine-binding chemotaxis protein CheW